MRSIPILVGLFLLAFLTCIVAPPVDKKKDDADSKENEIPSKEDGFGIEYERYLQEVVQALESDPQFREKLQKAGEADIRSGKIAHELELVNHAVRTRLDEVKRAEIERLRHYARKAYELEQGLDTDHLKIQPNLETDHIDHSNPHTFEVEDLKKLIAKTTKDLAEADVKRREEFKDYEMQKQFELDQKLKNMSKEEKEKYEHEVNELKEKHKKHAPLHHPGSKQQLEEVWEKEDHMENQDFNPKAFFFMHDLDGNGVWDANEVKALFLKELDKMYNAGAPEDDMKERNEEMERMREHVFKEADSNRDGLISYEEFLAQTQRPDFNSDSGWEGLDQQTVYTPDEYHNFEMQRQHEIEQMIADGRLPPYSSHGMHPPPGMQQHYPNAAGYPGNAHSQQFGGHPQQSQEQFQQGHAPQYHQGHPQQFQPGQSQQFQQAHSQQFPQGQAQHFQQGHPQQFQQGQPQQFQQVHPEKFQQGHPQQFQQGQPQQFQQVHPQQTQQGHPQQFQQGQPQQGQPQQFQQVHPQQTQQGQPVQFQQPQAQAQGQHAPQIPVSNNIHHSDSHISNQAPQVSNEGVAKVQHAAPVPPSPVVSHSNLSETHQVKSDASVNNNQDQPGVGVQQI